MRIGSQFRIYRLLLKSPLWTYRYINNLLSYYISLTVFNSCWITARIVSIWPQWSQCLKHWSNSPWNQRFITETPSLDTLWIWQNWEFLFIRGFCAELSQTVIQKSRPYCSLLKTVKIYGLLQACHFVNIHKIIKLIQCSKMPTPCSWTDSSGNNDSNCFIFWGSRVGCSCI